MSDYFPLAPTIDNVTSLPTYNDMVERILDSLALETSDRNVRNARRAIQEAYLDMGNCRNWTYYYRWSAVTTEASVTEGTVQYTAATRTLTLTGATWPANALYYTVRINQVNYPITARIDDSNVQLDEHNCPTADIAAGASYVAYRDCFPLAQNVITASRMVDVSAVNRVIDYVSPGEYLERNRGYVATNWPWYYTYMKSPRNFGLYGIFFGQPPNSVRTYNYAYRCRPMPMSIERYCQGKITFPASGVVATGDSTTNFTAAMLGSVIRFSADGINLPTATEGGFDGFNPYVVARMIQSVDSNARTLTLDQASGLPADLTNVKYQISSPVDFEEGVMGPYFYRQCEYKMSVLERRDDAESRAKLAFSALTDAAIADNRHFEAEGGAVFSGRLRDIAQQIVLS